MEAHYKINFKLRFPKTRSFKAIFSKSILPLIGGQKQ